MRYLLIVILIFCLSSCGFRPRGSIPLAPPLHNLYLQTKDPYGQLAHILNQYFKTSGVSLASTPQNATVVLEILSEQTSEQLLSVGGTELTRQYNLILTVTFQLKDSKGKILVGPQVLQQRITIPIRSNQVLAGSNEANSLYQKMRNAIAFDLMHRLASKNITDILLGENKHP